MWKPKEIPELKNGVWTTRTFTEKKEFEEFLLSQFKEPGKYNLKDTYLWRQPAISFDKNKRYCNFPEKSEEFKNYFAREKKKIGQGVIINDFFVPGDYYWYLNFTPIVDKVKKREDFAEMWDGDYHYYLYGEIARHVSLNEAVVKARQKGFSLKIVSKLVRKLWFVRQSVSKMVGYEEDHTNTNGSWKFANNYRSFLNEHTPWYRDFEPDGVLEWEQKKTVIQGLTNTKKTTKGLKSRLTGATTKKNPAKAVGGLITDLFCEEAGIAPNLDKVLEFAEAATKMGGVKTGHVIVSGAVGELKDCAPLEAIAFAPEKNGFLGVTDIFSEVPHDEKICFFFPDYWNYLAIDEEGNPVKCYDEDGNSDIELAKEYLLKEEEKQKTKDNFILWKSQHPWNLQDAFAIREDNIFPTRIVKDHQTLLRQTYNPLTVKLLENNGQISHELSYDPPVSTLKINPTKDNRGVIEIDELPIDNPPWGLYYAGVDPIRQTNTVTSKSLMSVYIMKASHVDSKGRMVADFPVARYTGRFPTWEETYEVSMRLCRYYNARVAVESNVTGFHEWAIQKNYGYYFMHRKEIYLLNEWMPNSTIQNEIGIRMEGEFKKKALDFAVAYVDEIISSYEKDGEKQYIYGVSRLRDIMLMEEMLKFTAKLNTDRIVSFTLALIAARSSTNRSLVVKETSETNINQNRSLKLPTKVSYKLPSPLTKYKGLR
jgi:hypothetical protein